MKLKIYIQKGLNLILNLFGYEIIEIKNLYEWQKHPVILPGYNESDLPPTAAEYLYLENPRLHDLQARYSAFDKAVTTPLFWADALIKADEILYFRGDNAYVWQLRGPNMNILSYALTTYYVKSLDTLGLLDLLEEDDLFGNYTFRVGNKLVSRDLLDSIMEIYFLEKHLNLSISEGMTILDIGAGYGRLAHKMVNALPNIQNYLCTDAIAISTFLSEYYIQFRNMGDKAKAIPLDEIENALQNFSVNIAINVHSFSECELSAIDWWLSLLEKFQVKYLMIVPNAGDHNGDLLLKNDDKDFGKVIEKHGYKMVVKEPKYRDPIVQQYGINPTYHYLFELQ